MNIAATITAVHDVRGLPCAARKETIFGTFDSLADGEAFEFINDHDPAPLQGLFAARYGERFGWAYVVAGPDEWRIRITRG
ncbi:DUF2249 domain-containing protein [Consotaella salsifontis]|uniref:Uncharacterized conserved protein, DUF2249 family n=1 Tax=Consotaella salsifontis TaxID=1365950 RepID=A0A1T4LD01_9HYPH|nr:DUF2249 domain-containing protein [Consotaella salsifontis]SJZ52427.1 Uncharacterized conserved protein, DUF2249 family [Consotaella salsifontis]